MGNYLERAMLRWPDRPVTGSGHLAVVSPTSVRLFEGIPAYRPDSDFDEWTTLLIAGKGTRRLIDLRDVHPELPTPVPVTKVEPSKAKLNYSRLRYNPADQERD